MRLVIFICLFLSIYVLFCSVAESADFTKNLLIYYKFDKDNGDEVIDSSGNDNNGTMKNGVEIVKGKFDKCAEFPGGTGHIETIIDVPENNFTMALWLKTDNPGVGVYSVLDGVAGAGGHDRHFYIQGGNICFRVWQGGGWCTGTGVADGDWHHVALVTEDGEGQTAYVDGDKVGTNPYDHSDFNWQNRVWVGFSNDGAVDYFEGLIDEVVYLDRPLTDNEIGQLMNPRISVDSIGGLTSTWGLIKIVN